MLTSLKSGPHAARWLPMPPSLLGMSVVAPSRRGVHMEINRRQDMPGEPDHSSADFARCHSALFCLSATHNHDPPHSKPYSRSAPPERWSRPACESLE